MAMPPAEPPIDGPGGPDPNRPPGRGSGYPPPGQPNQPPGGYPPPGGYTPPGQPPPSGGGWGSGGSGNSGGGYGGSYGGGGGYGGGRIDIGRSVSYAWTKFGQNAGPLIICTIIVFVVQIAVFALAAAMDTGLAQFVIRIVGAIVGLVLTRGLIRAGLSVVNGNRVETAQVFRFDNIGGFVVGSIILGLIQGLATVIPVLILNPILGSIVAIVLVAVVNTLFGFYGFAIVERDLDGVSGLKRSLELTRPHFGNVLLFWIVMGVISIIGALACGVGLLVAIPITYVAQAHAYRQLSGASVAP